MKIFKKDHKWKERYPFTIIDDNTHFISSSSERYSWMRMSAPTPIKYKFNIYPTAEVLLRCFQFNFRACGEFISTKNSAELFELCKEMSKKYRIKDTNNSDTIDFIRHILDLKTGLYHKEYIVFGERLKELEGLYILSDYIRDNDESPTFDCLFLNRVQYGDNWFGNNVLGDLWASRRNFLIASEHRYGYRYG